MTPPLPLDAERAVLGSILLKPDVLYAVRAVIKSDQYFGVEANQTIWRGMCAIQDRGFVPDEAMVLTALQKAKRLGEVGGHAYVSWLMGGSFTPSRATDYAQEVAEAYYNRVLDAEGPRLFLANGTHSIRERVALIDGSWYAIRTRVLVDDEPLEKALEQQERMLEGLINSPRIVPGLTTPWPEVNRYLIYGLRDDLITLGAETSKGKSSAMLTLAHHWATQGHCGLILSIEENQQKIVNRFNELCVPERDFLAEYDPNDTRPLARLKQQYLPQAKELVRRHISIRHNPTQIDDIEATILSHVHQYKDTKFVFVDYLQRIRHKEKGLRGTYESVSYVMSRLADVKKKSNFHSLCCPSLDAQTGTTPAWESTVSRDRAKLRMTRTLSCFSGRRRKTRRARNSNTGRQIFAFRMTALLRNSVKARQGEPVWST